MYSEAGSGSSTSVAGSWTVDNGFATYTPGPEIAAEHNFKIHRQACKLHEEGPISCHGFLKRKQNQCMKKATSFPQGAMPTCKLHQDQIFKASRCKVPAACGKLCGRLSVWIPHSLQRCSIHHDYPMPCFFLKIPLELRTRIYEYLLPNQDITAIQEIGPVLRLSRKMAILQVNHQIHDEATTFMYSVNTFVINLEKEGLSMCNHRAMQVNTWQDRTTNTMWSGYHALNDYQMQLMLLEQQNKRRIMMARQQQNAGQPDSQSSQVNAQNPLANIFVNSAGPSGSHVPQQPQYHHNRIPASPSRTEDQQSENRVWTASLAPRYFNLIRSFRIEINFPPPVVAFNGHPVEQDPDEQSQQLYTFNDQLHRLISRFETQNRAITRLEIDINFLGTYSLVEEAVSAADVLLRPFRRLCGVERANVRSITMRNPNRYQNSSQDDGNDNLINLLTPNPSQANENLLEYLSYFSLALRSPTPSLLPSPIFEAYWRLTTLIDKIKIHCNTPITTKGITKGFDFVGLKHKARVAREDGDSKEFREVFERVLEVWQRYMDWERDFQRDTWQDIEGVWEVFEDGCER